MFYYDDLKTRYSQPNTESNQSSNPFAQIGRGVLYGAVEGVENISNFFTDTLPSAVGVGSLLRWDNPIEAPTSQYGQLVGGLSQFFIPYLGVSKALTVGSAAYGVTRAGGAQLAWLAGVRPTQALARAETAGGSLRAAALASMIARETVKGGVVDFLAFGKDGGRLSDLIQANPNLANPISGFLSSDDEDSEVEARFKNLLEGAVLGVALDSVIGAFRYRRAKTKALASGASEVEADKIASLKVEESIESDIAAARARDAADDKLFEESVFELEVEETAQGTVYRAADTPIDGGSQLSASGSAEKEIADVVKPLGYKVGDPGTPETPIVPRRPATTKKLTGKQLQDEVDKIVKSRFDDDFIIERLNEDDLANVVEELPKDAQAGELRVNPRKLTKDERLLKNISKRDQNRSQFRSDLERLKGIPEFGTRLFRAIERLDLDVKDLSVSHKQHLAKTLVEVRRLGKAGSAQEFNDFVIKLSKDPEQLTKIALRAKAGRIIAEEHARSFLPALQKAAKDADLTFEQAQALTRELDIHFQIQQGVRRIYSGFGSGLSSAGAKLDFGKIHERLGGDAFVVKPLEYLKAITPETFDRRRVQDLLDILQNITSGPDPLGNSVALKEFFDAPASRQITLALRAAHVNGLLSGVATHVVNTASAIFLSVLKPAEQILAGVALRDRSLVREAITSYTHLWSDFLETYRAIRQTGHHPFVGRSKTYDPSTSPIRLLGQTPAGQKLGGESLFTPLARVIELPSKLLNKEDIFLKLFTGRNAARANMVRSFVKEGMPYDQALDRANELLSEVLKSEGDIADRLSVLRGIQSLGGEVSGSNSLLSGLRPGEADSLLAALERGTQRASEVTFTGDLAQRSLFSSAATATSTLISNHPGLGFIVPFVNTVSNIAQFGWDRSIGAVFGAGAEYSRALVRKFGLDIAPDVEKSFFKLSRDLASPDEYVRADARARMSYGVGAVGTILFLTTVSPGEDGLPMLTGSGPTDPDVRKTLEAAGWAPFSMRIGGTYVSYSRLDPIASLLGIVVDAAEVLKEGVEDDRQSLFTAITRAATASVANNLTSKTYAQGISQLLETIQDPEANAEKLLGQLAGSFVPTIVANVERVVDPEAQQIRSWTDRVLSRIPGLSSRLPVSRDILGQPIVREVHSWEPLLPLRLTRVKDSVVEKEISRFAYGFSPLSNKIGGIDLLDEQYDQDGRAAYDQYASLVGELRIKGKDLRQALRQVIQSPVYQSLDPEQGPNGERSPRIEYIQKTIRQYRRAAFTELLRLRPDLKKASKDAESVRAQRRKGRNSLFSL